MRHHHERTLVLLEHRLQCLQRGKVEVVARFVEKQQLRCRIGDERQREGGLEALPAAQSGGRHRYLVRIEPEQGEPQA